MQTVELKCIKEGSRLRVRIISPGYNPNSNCSFPKAFRAEGRHYTVPASNISFSQDKSMKFFYRVKKNSIQIIEPNVVVPTKVYGNGPDDPVDCCVCMSEERACAFNCGHYITCLGCAGMLKVCPLCRVPISKIITKDQIG